MTNFELFCYSQNQQSALFDPYYNKGETILTSTRQEENELMRANHQLVNLISNFDELRKNGKGAHAPEVCALIESIVTLLDQVRGLNYSAFVQFFMVYNFAYSSYKTLSHEQKRNFIYKILIRYCIERHPLYLTHGYNDSLLQVVSDNYSHKRNSKTSINKMLELFESSEWKRLNDLNSTHIDDAFYFLPDKGDKLLFAQFKSRFALTFQSTSTEQGKLPDLVFGWKSHFFIVEAKMMKGSGGGQDKQLVEIINFIRYSESNTHIHYVTFLDGLYFNLLTAFGRTPKLEKQYRDIVNCLKQNAHNYFVNWFGFKWLISHLNELFR